jgi:hypothetical protein
MIEPCPATAKISLLLADVDGTLITTDKVLTARAATGYIVGATHSFTGAFVTAGVVLIAGIIAYVFLLGELVPIADPPAKEAAGRP